MRIGGVTCLLDSWSPHGIAQINRTKITPTVISLPQHFIYAPMLSCKVPKTVLHIIPLFQLWWGEDVVHRHYRHLELMESTAETLLTVSLAYECAACGYAVCLYVVLLFIFLITLYDVLYLHALQIWCGKIQGRDDLNSDRDLLELQYSAGDRMAEQKLWINRKHHRKSKLRSGEVCSRIPGLSFDLNYPSITTPDSIQECSQLDLWQLHGKHSGLTEVNSEKLRTPV
ncbi:hypothetical protein FB451DRAFT_1169622 [Mycena latifolia]|nr:hypothetical protein FB451DRAFT_1169622 [Mycena latifolia]